MAEIDAVGGGFEDDFVQADDFAFAEGSDFEVSGAAGRHFSAGFADQILERDGGTGGCVFFCGVVTLEDLSRVVVVQGSGGGAGGVVEEIDADGKISGVDEAGFVLVDEGVDAIEVVILIGAVPARSPDDHVLAGLDAGFDVGEDDVGRAEVDDGVDVVELFGSERGAGGVFFRAGDADVVLAFGGDFGDEGSGFAATQDEKVHNQQLTAGAKALFRARCLARPLRAAPPRHCPRR